MQAHSPTTAELARDILARRWFPGTFVASHDAWIDAAQRAVDGDEEDLEEIMTEDALFADAGWES